MESNTAGPVVGERPRLAPVAPMAHMVVLIVAIVGVSLLSANSQHTFAERSGRVVLYAATFAWEWLLAGFVLWGLRKQGVRLREIINARWSSPEIALLDLALAAGFWIVAALVLAGLGYTMGFAEKGNLEAARKALGFMIPGTRLELALWVGLSATAGFCEEVIFRGYLQRQFAALTQNAYAGILLSAVVFGCGHGYEGPKRMLLIAVYGAMFGVLAHFRKSLVPGMIAHAWHDGFSGIVLHVMRLNGG